jgi:hypothetical protein
MNELLKESCYEVNVYTYVLWKYIESTAESLAQGFTNVQVDEIKNRCKVTYILMYINSS